MGQFFEKKNNVGQIFKIEPVNFGTVSKMDLFFFPIHPISIFHRLYVGRAVVTVPLRVLP